MITAAAVGLLSNSAHTRWGGGGWDGSSGFQFGGDAFGGGDLSATNATSQPAVPRQIQTSNSLSDPKGYSLIDDGSAPESFLRGYEATYLPSKQWLAGNEYFPREVVKPPRPSLNLSLAAGASQ
jgi:hypothetical protein